MAENDLREAIEGCRVVRLRYTGDGDPRRTVHPHALYESEAGNLCLDCYQVDGYTTRGALPQWRRLTVDKIVSVDVLDERFTAAPAWNPDAERYQNGFVARA